MSNWAKRKRAVEQLESSRVKQRLRLQTGRRDALNRIAVDKALKVITEMECALVNESTVEVKRTAGSNK
jgi:hypothetical protein